MSNRIKISVSDVPTSKSTSRYRSINAEFDAEIAEFRDALGMRIIDMMARKYVDEFGDELLAALDLETIKKKTNEKVTVEALKRLSA